MIWMSADQLYPSSIGIAVEKLSHDIALVRHLLAFHTPQTRYHVHLIDFPTQALLFIFPSSKPLLHYQEDYRCIDTL